MQAQPKKYGTQGRALKPVVGDGNNPQSPKSGTGSTPPSSQPVSAASNSSTDTNPGAEGVTRKKRKKRKKRETTRSAEDSVDTSKKKLLDPDKADSADDAEDEDVTEVDTEHGITEKDLENGEEDETQAEFIRENEELWKIIVQITFAVTAAASVAFLYYDTIEDLDQNPYTNDNNSTNSNSSIYIDHFNEELLWEINHFALLICGILSNCVQTLLYTGVPVGLVIALILNKSISWWAKLFSLMPILILAAFGDTPYGAADYESDHTLWRSILVFYGNFPLIAYAITTIIVDWFVKKAEQCRHMATDDDEDYQTFLDTVIARRLLTQFYQSAAQSLKINRVLVPNNFSHLETLKFILQNAPEDKILFNFIKDARYYAGETAQVIGAAGCVGSNPGYTCSNQLTFAQLFSKLSPAGSWTLGVVDMIPVYIMCWAAGPVTKELVLGILDAIASLRKNKEEKNNTESPKRSWGDAIPYIIALPGAYSHGASYFLTTQNCPNSPIVQNWGVYSVVIVFTNIVNSYWTKKSGDKIYTGYILFNGTDAQKLEIHSQRNFEEFCDKIKTLTTDEIKQEVSEIQKQQARADEWNRCVNSLTSGEKAALGRLDIGQKPVDNSPKSSASSANANGDVESQRKIESDSESKTDKPTPAASSISTQNTTQISSSRWSVFNCLNRRKGKEETEKLLSDRHAQEGCFNRVMRRLPSFVCPG